MPRCPWACIRLCEVEFAQSARGTPRSQGPASLPWTDAGSGDTLGLAVTSDHCVWHVSVATGVLTLLAGHPLQCPRAAGATARKWCNTPRDNPQSSEHNSERPGSSTNSASHLQITCNTSVRSRTHQGGPARPCRYSHPTSGAPAFRSGNRAAWVNCALGSFRLSSRCSECLR